MTVKELIKILRKLPQDFPVMVEADYEYKSKKGKPRFDTTVKPCREAVVRCNSNVVNVSD